MSHTPEIVKEGWLKRVKNQKKRYFVLCFNKDSGAAQLQYYENEKKYHSKSEPKRTIYLRDCLGIIARQDPKEGLVLVLYTKEDIFSLTTEDDDSLQSWLSDLDKLHKMEYKNLQDSKYDLVWNVMVLPVKNMSGSYKLCLKDESLYFVNPVSQEVVNEEKLCYVRRYGHMDNRFFMEFGRSATLGPGEIWMEVDDPLIAQKIHETLCRSVKPPSSAVTDNHTYREPRKSRNKHNRHSMVNVDPNNFLIDAINNNNNDPSPKARRSFLTNVFTKKQKDTARPHSKSMSADLSLDPDNVLNKCPRSSPSFDHQDVNQHYEQDGYPRITPPRPLADLAHGKSSKTSLPAFPSEDVSFKKVEKQGPDTKSLPERSVDKAQGNDYTTIKPKRRSVIKQDCNTVRNDFAEERRSRSLPRRPSATSTERLRIGSTKSTDSDKDVAHASDDEGERHSFEHQESDYANSSQFRPRLTSDDSAPHVPARPSDPPGYYTHMYRPNSRSPRCSTSSARSCDSAEDPADQKAYMNMSPGKRGPWAPVRLASSSSSNGQTDDDWSADTCEETFDHLCRDESASDEIAPPSNEECYVNMRPQSMDSGVVSKTRAESLRKKPSDYVNVNINRSKSLGSKSPRPRPLFEILPEQSDRLSSDDETTRHTPSSYVNMQITNDKTNSHEVLQSTNSTPLQKTEMESRKSDKLNYASVTFSETPPSTPNGTHRKSYHGRKSQSNYSKIDFTKSKGLEEISSSRELQLQQGIHY